MAGSETEPGGRGRAQLTHWGPHRGATDPLRVGQPRLRSDGAAESAPDHRALPASVSRGRMRILKAPRTALYTCRRSSVKSGPVPTFDRLTTGQESDLPVNGRRYRN